MLTSIFFIKFRTLFFSVLLIISSFPLTLSTLFLSNVDRLLNAALLDFQAFSICWRLSPNFLLCIKVPDSASNCYKVCLRIRFFAKRKDFIFSQRFYYHAKISKTNHNFGKMSDFYWELLKNMCIYKIFLLLLSLTQI